jgi:hypothetical protein
LSVHGWTRRQQVLCAAVAAGALLLLPAPPTSAAPADSHDALVKTLRRSASGQLRMTRHLATGRLRFLGAADGRPLERRRGAGSRPAEGVARAFMRRYAGLFGAPRTAADLRVVKTSRLADGSKAVRFQQLAAGVPVVGGELVVALDRDNNVLSASGETTRAAGVAATASSTQPRCRPRRRRPGGPGRANRRCRPARRGTGPARLRPRPARRARLVACVADLAGERARRR